MATVVLHEHTHHAARVVGLPVLAFGQCFFSIGEFIPPTEFLEQHVVEFGVTGGDVCALGVRTIFSQQVFAVFLDAEVGAEVTATVHDVLRGVVQIR